MPSITIQIATAATSVPPRALLRAWAKNTLKTQQARKSLTLRVIDPDEMQTLNRTYRHKDKPTNVLSFHNDDEDYLGDIALCAAVIATEATDQEKTLEEHWAHMVVHGILHLLGYDHETAGEAAVMEALEIEQLALLGFDNPYETS